MSQTTKKEDEGIGTRDHHGDRKRAAEGNEQVSGRARNLFKTCNGSECHIDWPGET